MVYAVDEQNLRNRRSLWMKNAESLGLLGLGWGVLNREWISRR